MMLLRIVFIVGCVIIGVGIFAGCLYILTKED